MAEEWERFASAITGKNPSNQPQVPELNADGYVLVEAKGRAYYSEDTATGTTTDTYANAADLDCREFSTLYLILKNTAGANGLKYKVLTRAHYVSGAEDEEQAETTLAAGGAAEVKLWPIGARIRVQVKAAVDGAQATYQIDHILRGA